MSTRLESAARDYAIAVLSAPGSPNVWVAASAVERATVYGPVYSAWTRNIDTDALGDLVHVVPPRILRARVAVYLRTVRRTEAWERGERWALAWYLDPHGFADTGVSIAGLARYCARAGLPLPRWCPWKPLWTSAPPHDPTMTPAQRRASRRGMVSP